MTRTLTALPLAAALICGACSTTTDQKILANVQAVEANAVVGANTMCLVGASLLPFIQTGTAVASGATAALAPKSASSVATVVADVGTVAAAAVAACTAIQGTVVKTAS